LKYRSYLFANYFNTTTHMTNGVTLSHSDRGRDLPVVGSRRVVM